jgi:hypothetical protein
MMRFNWIVPSRSLFAVRMLAHLEASRSQSIDFHERDTMARHIKAFGIELLFGYMGWLGVGWLYARKPIGVLLVLVWLPFLLGMILGIVNAESWLPAAEFAICGALLLFPIYVGVPLLSAYALRRRLEPPVTGTEMDPGEVSAAFRATSLVDRLFRR